MVVALGFIGVIVPLGCYPGLLIMFDLYTVSYMQSSSPESSPDLTGLDFPWVFLSPPVNRDSTGEPVELHSYETENMIAKGEALLDC